jgi:glycosyltransferase involved in cell wall biosynthesis
MSSGSVQFDTSFDIQIKKDLLKSHSIQKLFPQLNWEEKSQSLETAYFTIANAFNELKGYEEAIEYLEKCLEINKREDYYCALGLTYFNLNEFQKSIWAFDKAVKLNPENEKAKEISNNIHTMIAAKNQKHQLNHVTPDFNTDWKCQHAEEMGPQISVIVPTFNRPESLEESIKSILSQTYQNFEIVVVNDAGEDVSESIRKFQDPRIKYIQHQKNKGLAAARNTGIKNASGRYIALLDDDDIFYPEHLDLVAKCLSADVPVIYTDAVRATYERCGDNYYLIKKNVPYSIEFDRNKLLVGNISPVNCFVFDKNLAYQAGLFDETLSTLEDWDFWIRLSALVSFKHLAQPTVQVNWRNDGTTMTSLLGSEFKKNRERIYKRYQEEINRVPNLQAIMEEFQQIWANDWQVQSRLTSIIILTCNQIEYTRKCLDSIFMHTQGPFELIIVDNGSTDGTVEYLESEVLKKHSDLSIKIIKNNENKGSEIGIIGPRSNYVSGPQRVEEIDYDIHTLKGLTEFSNKFADDHVGQIQQVLRVVGFCMLIKRAVIDKIGAMDDRYRLGNFEDDDFSLRAAIAGFQSWIARDCFIHHFGHRTFIGEKVDLDKSLDKNWGIFKEKWGLPADKPYGSPYTLSEMKLTRFDPSIHYYPLDNERAAMDKYNHDFKSAETLYSGILANLNSKPSEEVIEDLQRLIESYPEFALAYNDLGVLYYSSGNKKKALECYERAVQLDPENSNFNKNLADFYFVEMGRVEEALQIYVKTLENDPQDTETLLIIGNICVALHNLDDAKVFYRRVLELEPQNEDAQGNLNKLDKMKPNAPELKSAEELYQEIQASSNNGDPHKAISRLEELLQSYPDFALAQNDLGVLYYHTGDKEKARHHYERAVELMPDNISFQKNLADFLFVEQGKVEEALQIYVNILETHPEDVETLLITGHICVALKKFDDAKEFYKRVLALAPDNEDASKNLQALMNRQAKWASAKRGSFDDVTVSSAKNVSIDLNTEESENHDFGNKPDVSIVVFLDGIQNRVKECLKSIQEHTLEPHELLLVDRGATKGMLKWAQQLIKDKNDYHIIECAKTQGRAESLNQAIQKAGGEIIVLMHNDVVVPESWLNGFEMCIKLEPNIGVVGPISNRAAGIQQLMHPGEADRVEFESAAEAFREQNQYRRVATRKLSDSGSAR